MYSLKTGTVHTFDNGWDEGSLETIKIAFTPLQDPNHLDNLKGFRTTREILQKFQPNSFISSEPRKDQEDCPFQPNSKGTMRDSKHRRFVLWKFHSYLASS